MTYRESNPRKLRSAILPIFGVLAAMLLAGIWTGCANQVSMDEHQSAVDERDSVINEMVNTFMEIEVALDEIKKAEAILADSEHPEFGTEGREALVTDIHGLGLILEKNREKVVELEGQLEQYGIEMDAFRTKVRRLTAEVEERQSEIAGLHELVAVKDEEIGGLSQEVDSLNFTLAETIVQAEMEIYETTSVLDSTSHVLERTSDRMHTAYVATGTSKELKDQGLVSSRFLGKPEFDVTAPSQPFTQIDIREITEIPLASDRAKLVTVHPEESYKFVEHEETRTATLEILNPDEFWKASKYLVVSVK